MLGEIYVTQVYCVVAISPKTPKVIRFKCGDLQVTVDYHTHELKAISLMPNYLPIHLHYKF